MDNIGMINKQRKYFMEKAHAQLDGAFVLSLDGNTEGHKRALDDLETSIIIVSRFDRRLRDATVHSNA